MMHNLATYTVRLVFLIISQLLTFIFNTIRVPMRITSLNHTSSYFCQLHQSYTTGLVHDIPESHESYEWLHIRRREICQLIWTDFKIRLVRLKVVVSVAYCSVWSIGDLVSFNRLHGWNMIMQIRSQVSCTKDSRRGEPGHVWRYSYEYALVWWEILCRHRNYVELSGSGRAFNWTKEMRDEDGKEVEQGSDV